MIKQKLLTVFVFTIFLTSLYAQQQINRFDENGKRHGLWQKNYPKTNQLRYKGQFVHGKEVDTFRYYKLKNRKSVLSALKVFNKDNDIANVIFYTSKGKIVSKGQMRGKTYVGQWEYYHKNSDELMISETYNPTGQLTGERKVYYKNGQIAELATYTNGYLNGWSKWFSETGKLLQKSEYKNDKLNGQSVYYDTYGNLKAKGYYKDNLKIGIWSYFENGSLVRKVNHDTNEVIHNKR